MDILSHGLWSVAAANARNMKNPGESRIRLGRAFFWGVIPDLAAFGIPFAWLFWNIFLGNTSFSDFPRPESGGAGPSVNDYWLLGFASNVYNYSHSLLLFIIVFSVVWYWYGRPQWEMGAWGLHILMDIPTHTYQFFPTPFLWPVADLKVNGISWAEPWFMAANILLLVLTYGYFYRRKRKAMHA